MVLPTGFASLRVPWQLLVLSNLERVDRGLAPVLGVSGALNHDAAIAAAADADPMPSAFYGDAWSANWEGGLPSPLEADFVWMYDDGYGSDNGGCRTPGAPGCWGHRHDILAAFSTPIVMGAADRTGAYGPSLTELFVGGDVQAGAGEANAPMAPAWSSIRHRLPLGISPPAVHLPQGVLSGYLVVSASGEPTTVSASITANRRRWSVSPARCRLAAGARCRLKVSVAASTSRRTGTLTVRGSNRAQTVALWAQ